jgi:hypothetical protein
MTRGDFATPVPPVGMRGGANACLGAFATGSVAIGDQRSRGAADEYTVFIAVGISGMVEPAARFVAQ